MAICPTCHTSVDEVISQPTTSQIQSIAPPTDMSGVLSAVQQLIYNFNQITNNGPSNQKPKTGRFQEVTAKRITKKMKVYSKQDKETFVEYKQINGMTFKDTVTGEQWKWERGNDDSNQ